MNEGMTKKQAAEQVIKENPTFGAKEVVAQVKKQFKMDVSENYVYDLLKKCKTEQPLAAAVPPRQQDARPLEGGVSTATQPIAAAPVPAKAATAVMEQNGEVDECGIPVNVLKDMAQVRALASQVGGTARLKMLASKLIDIGVE